MLPLEVERFLLCFQLEMIDSLIEFGFHMMMMVIV